MKNRTRNLLAATGALMAVGIAFTCTGRVLGAKTINMENGKLYVDGNGSDFSFGNMQFFAQRYEQTADTNEIYTKEFADSRINEIDIEGCAVDLEIIPGSEWKISHKKVYPLGVSYKEEKGKLIVKGSGKVNSKIKNKITIYVPDSPDKLEVSHVVGDMKIEGLVFGEVEISGNVGNVELNNVTTGELEIEGAVGNIESSGVTAKNASLEGGVGDINISGEFSDKLEIEGGVGNIKVKIENAELTDYDLEIKQGLGGVEVEGLEISKGSAKSFEVKEGRGRKIEIEGGLGEVSVSFD